ncbi:hypothetical protein, partial [Escherichia coli]|uniref:hypothetical protein n=1 Tax=Escherichia coli TaxID=562 RepID=UPI0034E47F4D
SHWSTSKTPSYTKSVSWQHHPLYEMISQYYWIKFNPELSIEKTLLDTLGFKPCKRCFSLST